MDFEFHRKLNLLVGVSALLPETFEKSSKFFKLSWKFYEYFGLFLTTGWVFTLVTTLIMNFDDLEIACTSGGAALFIFQLAFKKVVFQTYDERFKNLIKNMLDTSEILNRNPVKNTDFPSMFKKTYKTIKTITLVKVTVEAVGMTGLIGLFLVHGLVSDNPDDRKMPAYYWTPYDFRETGNYIFSLVLENILGALGFVRNTAMDSLFCTILITLSLQLRFLKRILELILERYEKNRGDIFSVTKPKENEVKEKREENIDGLEKDLKWWLAVHQKILKSVADIRVISSSYLAYIFFTMAAEFFIIGTVSTTSFWNAFQKYLIIALILTNIFQLYVISTIGDTLLDDGLVATDGGFNVNLLLSSSFIRKSYLFALMRGKQPILLKAAQLSPLSADTFGNVARITFSYFVTVLQIRQERDAASEK